MAGTAARVLTAPVGPDVTDVTGGTSTAPRTFSPPNSTLLLGVGEREL